MRGHREGKAGGISFPRSHGLREASGNWGIDLGVLGLRFEPCGFLCPQGPPETGWGSKEEREVEEAETCSWEGQRGVGAGWGGGVRE